MLILKEKNIALVFLVLITLAISSCSTKEDQRLLGSAVGAALGGLVGAQFGAGTGKLMMTALGAGAGSFLGGEIADRMTETEKLSLNESLNNTAKFGNINQEYSWSNESKNISAIMTPISEIKADKGTCKNIKVQMSDGHNTEFNKTEVCFKNS